jgi:hypothetical protein
MRQTGVVFHMMSALGELGRMGLTAIGNSHEEAKATYDRAIAAGEDQLPLSSCSRFSARREIFWGAHGSRARLVL